MPRTCCVPGCGGLKPLHIFPKNSESIIQWIQRIGRLDFLELDPVQIRHGYRVCSRHFPIEDKYSLKDRVRLRPTALPTLAMPQKHLPNNIAMLYREVHEIKCKQIVTLKMVAEENEITAEESDVDSEGEACEGTQFNMNSCDILKKIIEEGQPPATPWHIPCPTSTMPYGYYVLKEACVLFVRLCPPHLTMIEVTAGRSQGKYSCIWRVRYTYKEKQKRESADDLLLQLRLRAPQNTDILSQSCVYMPESWVFDYGVIGCECRSGSDGTQDTESSDEDC